VVFRQQSVEEIYEQIFVYLLAKELLKPKISEWINIPGFHSVKIAWKVGSKFNSDILKHCYFIC
jgi:hypothetical protein